MASKIEKVIIAPPAAEDLDELVGYLKAEWGIAVATSLLSKFENFIDIIKIYPTLFPYFNKSKKLRKHTIYKRNMVVYRVIKSTVEIVAVINANQRLSKIKKTVNKRLDI
jgi:plasmid stabilization system protein ParE